MTAAARVEMCGNCRYGTPGFAGNVTCRRFPPARIEIADAMGYRPTTRREDWCGEYQPKAQEP